MMLQNARVGRRKSCHFGDNVTITAIFLLQRSSNDGPGFLSKTCQGTTGNIYLSVKTTINIIHDQARAPQILAGKVCCAFGHCLEKGLPRIIDESKQACDVSLLASGGQRVQSLLLFKEAFRAVRPLRVSSAGMPLTIVRRGQA